MRITLITVGNIKEDYLRAAYADYCRRLRTLAELSEVELREERITDEDNPAAVRAALAAEGERILARIPQGAYTVALCVEGKEMPSEALAAHLGEASAHSGKLCLIIGSSHGLDPAVKARADLRLSVSALTFPHQLMRVMTAEILYRSCAILAGKRYHK